jgi:hyaluronoglucosaminidase
VNSTLCAPAQYGIQPCSLTQTGGECDLPNCTGWSQGAFPSLNQDGTPAVNGGVPQAADLEMHLLLLRRQIASFIPDASYSGNAVLDMETWTPLWEENNNPDVGWHGVQYQEYSITLAAAKCTNCSLSEIVALARIEFESAAIRFMTRTLEVLKELRPNARWGYYGYPQGHYRSAPTPYFQNQSDRLANIWNASSAIFPSVYLPSQPFYLNESTWRTANAEYVANTTLEAVRVSQTFGNSVPVIGFHYPFYHSGVSGTTARDVRLVIAETYMPPLATGLIVWMYVPGRQAAQLPLLMQTDEGPVFAEAAALAANCSSRLCSGNGWCKSPFPEDWCVESSSACRRDGCECFPGYKGRNCE